MEQKSFESSGSIFLDIGDGGIGFQVDFDQRFGPTITISHSHFGNVSTATRVFTDRESLRKLGEFFVKMAKTKPARGEGEYVYAAKVYDQPACSEGCCGEESVLPHIKNPS
jgi:hypothetical protein